MPPLLTNPWFILLYYLATGLVGLAGGWWIVKRKRERLRREWEELHRDDGPESGPPPAAP